jgi:ABC-type transport system involved in multi-copper enzyme maturation permease subunit
MIKKLWAIVYKDIYETFTDSSLLLIMLVTPLALATIISLAFSTITSSSSAPLRDIPVALVNQDVGEQGAIFVNLLVPDAPMSAETSDQPATMQFDCPDEAGTTSPESETDNLLLELTDAVIFDTPQDARQAVDRGEYAVAIIIPADFTEKMTYSPTNDRVQVLPVEVYADSNRAVSASVMQSVTESIINQMLVGQIAVSSTIQTLLAEGRFEEAGRIDPCLFAMAFSPDSGTVRLVQESVRETDDSSDGMNLLIMFGAAQAVFFALFTASGSASYVLEERHDGTWQRLNATPTPRLLILFGKYLSTVANVLLQLCFLIVGFMVIDSLMKGQFSPIWGTNWGLLALLVVLLALSVSGVGVIVSALSSTAEQANMIGQVIALFMGALGGAFFMLGDGVPAILDFLSRFSLVYWGRDALLTLSAGETDIGLHLAMMAFLGVLLFVIGAVIFARREDI